MSLWKKTEDIDRGFIFIFVQKDEAITLVSEAICAGIFNDLGSGSNVDVCVITKVCGHSPIAILTAPKST